MRKMVMAWILPFVLLGSCDKELVEYEKGSVEIVVERGDAWLHDFPLFLGIKRKNPPQIAVWIEDAQGRYLSTVYASSKIATQSWQRRAETAAGRRCLTGAIGRGVPICRRALPADEKRTAGGRHIGCHAARQFRPEVLARGGARSVRRKGRGEPFDRFQRNLSRIGQGGGARLFGRAARGAASRPWSMPPTSTCRRAGSSSKPCW